MRRSTLIAVLIGALTGLAVAAGISVAGSGDSSSSKGGGTSAGTASGGANVAHKRGGRRGHRGRGHRGHRGHGLRFGPMALAFDDFAERLGKSPRELHAAIRGVKKRALDRAVSDGTITQAERDALAKCLKTRARRGGCDRRAARAGHRKLHRALKQRARSDAAGLKAQFIDDLAAELGKQPAEVESAARAELEDLLDMAVTAGFVTERGRELALGCFDRPNECDRAALRAEVKKRFRGLHGGGKRGRRP